MFCAAAAAYLRAIKFPLITRKNPENFSFNIHCRYVHYTYLAKRQHFDKEFLLQFFVLLFSIEMRFHTHTHSSEWDKFIDRYTKFFLDILCACSVYIPRREKINFFCCCCKQHSHKKRTILHSSSPKKKIGRNSIKSHAQSMMMFRNFRVIDFIIMLLCFFFGNVI